MLKPEVFALPAASEGICYFCGRQYCQDHVIVALFAGRHRVGAICPQCLAVRYPATFVKAIRAGRTALQAEQPSLTEADLDELDRQQFRDCFAIDPCRTLMPHGDVSTPSSEPEPHRATERPDGAPLTGPTDQRQNPSVGAGTG